VASQFQGIRFNIVATRGTFPILETHGILIISSVINNVSMGFPHVVDAIKNGEIQLIINTGVDDEPRQNAYGMRRATIKRRIPCATTVPRAKATCRWIAALRSGYLFVKTIHEYTGGRCTIWMRSLQSTARAFNIPDSMDEAVMILSKEALLPSDKETPITHILWTIKKLLSLGVLMCRPQDCGLLKIWMVSEV